MGLSESGRRSLKANHLHNGTSGGIFGVKKMLEKAHESLLGERSEPYRRFYRLVL